jgi:glycosyltransferase involved in cell wall biosynthesis
VWVGRFRPEKRADLAIAAWATRPRNGELLVVGDGPGTAAVRDLAGGAKDIRLVGPAADPAGLYEKSNVFLQTSDAEGMSNALIEAMAAGCACIATVVGETTSVLGGDGSEELPKRGTFLRLPAGLIVNPGDLTGLDQALVALAEPSLRSELGLAAHARCLQHYRIEDIAGRYAELFASLRAAR